MSNYATKKELKHATGVDTTDVAAKKDFIALKHKIYTKKYTHIVKNTKFKTLEKKLSNLEKEIPDSTPLIHINQYNTDKRKFREKNWRC